MLDLDKINKFLGLNIKHYELKNKDVKDVDEFINEYKALIFNNTTSNSILKNLIQIILLEEIAKVQEEDLELINLDESIENSFYKENRRYIFNRIKHDFEFILPPMFTSNYYLAITWVIAIKLYIILIILITYYKEIIFVIPLYICLLFPFVIAVIISEILRNFLSSRNDIYNFQGISSLRALINEICKLNGERFSSNTNWSHYILRKFLVNFCSDNK